MRILLAEDDPTLREILVMRLETWGLDVVSAEDGCAAWQAFQVEDAPRIAILDWMMPGLDGVELCRRLRATTRSRVPYLILLTVRNESADIVAGLRAGADD